MTGHDLINPPDTNYLIALAMSLAILVLLIGPGLGWNFVRASRPPLRSAFVPLPGFALLTAGGLVLWVGHGVGAGAVVALILVVNLAAVVAIVWGWRQGRPIAEGFGEQGFGPFAIWICVVGAAMAIGVNPLPVAQEFPSGNTIPSRMVASSDDSAIPYVTSVYFFHGKNGGDSKDGSDDYFGEEWSVGSRGPIVPLAITTLLYMFQAEPSDPPDPEATSWPVTSEGAYIARFFGWLTNGMIVLGVGHLLTALNVGRSATRIGLAWAALAPATLINTVFLWPKLLSGFFILLSTACIFEAGWVIAGLCAALAWLSHPVGALFLPSLGGLLLWRSFHDASAGVSPLRRMFRSSIPFAAMLAFAMSPWLAFKLWLGRHDLFLDYLLAAGDTTIRARSFDAWLSVRLSNAKMTLIPGIFFTSGKMRGWLYGPLSEPLRWTVQYAKTLPSELGFSLFWAAYIAVIFPGRDRRWQALSWIGIVGALFVMIVFWGYSSDGLGRNCLEPLNYLLIVLAVSVFSPPSIIWKLGLAGLFVEGRWIEFSGFLGADGFAWKDVPAAAFLACIVSTALQLAILVWVWRDPAPSLDRDPSRQLADQPTAMIGARL
jgi:hypothetical protein